MNRDAPVNLSQHRVGEKEGEREREKFYPFTTCLWDKIRYFDISIQYISVHGKVG